MDDLKRCSNQMVETRLCDETKQSFPVTAMVVEPFNAVIQIHQWWEQNPGSLLIMAESQRLVVVTRWLATTLHYSVSDLWSLIKRSIVRKTFVVSEGEGGKKEPKQVAGEILCFFTRKNFNITDRGKTIILGPGIWKMAPQNNTLEVTKWDGPRLLFALCALRMRNSQEAL
ncbi:hypothetical protein Bca4012_012188 [Brassica carinata]